MATIAEKLLKVIDFKIKVDNVLLNHNISIPDKLSEYQLDKLYDKGKEDLISPSENFGKFTTTSDITYKYGKVVYKEIEADSNTYVDLNLPSGTLWATCNVGATSEEEYGQFFQWASVTGYVESTDSIISGHSYDWDSTPYCTDSSSSYNTSSWSKYTISNDLLEGTDDAAHVNMGGDWYMPTKVEFEELTNSENVDIEYNIEINGIKGHKFISKTDSTKYIFIPYAGYCSYSEHEISGTGASIWSNELSNIASAYFLGLGSGGGVSVTSSGRCGGYSIRGILRD